MLCDDILAAKRLLRHEIARIEKERDDALAVVKEVGPDGLELLRALRRIEAEDIPIGRQTRHRPGRRWLVGDFGLADTLLEALANNDKVTPV